MKKITIIEPIWKTNSVGLNIKGLDLQEEVLVEIAYKTKEGKKVFPEIYTMLVDKIITYPTQIVRHNVELHIVPISDLTIIK